MYSNGVQSVISVRDVVKRFAGITALDHVSLDFYPGEVHCLVGENGAGKSTLMKVLAGVYEKDAGEVRYSGEAKVFKSMKDARHSGTAIIFQEPGIVSSLSVAENIFLNNERKFRTAGFLNTRERNKAAEQLLNSVGCDFIDVKSQVSSLPYEEWKIVELARAVSTKDLRVLIVDEATAALGQNGQRMLYEQIRLLKERGVAVLFVSHRLKEIFEIGDRVTVMKDAKVVRTIAVTETTIEELPKLMVGRDISDYYSRLDDGDRGLDMREPLLTVEHLSAGGKLQDISFSLHRGEILGIAGLVDCGMHVLGRALFGIIPFEGRIVVQGRRHDSLTPQQAIDLGIGFVPRERDKEGLVLVHSMSDNIALPNLRQLLPQRLPVFVSDKKKGVLSERYRKELSIRAPSVKTLCYALSGGNRQKVVLGKWLARNVSILIMACPTRGIDVGAKAEIYHLMESLRKKGRGVMMISEELPELLGMSDRILVMKEGRVTWSVTRAENPTEEAIVAHMM